MTENRQRIGTRMTKMSSRLGDKCGNQWHDERLPFESQALEQLIGINGLAIIGGCVLTYIQSERSSARATPIPRCLGQPIIGKGYLGFHHPLPAQPS